MKTAETIIEELNRWIDAERKAKDSKGLIHLELAYCTRITYILEHYVYLSNEIRRLNNVML